MVGRQPRPHQGVPLVIACTIAQLSCPCEGQTAMMCWILSFDGLVLCDRESVLLGICVVVVIVVVLGVVVTIAHMRWKKSMKPSVG